jgi:predicted acetyltransferase
MPEIELIVATPDQRVVIENLMQFYVHDFSEFWWDQDRGELQADGRFEPYPLDPFWTEADHIPLLFRRAGHWVGFALLDRSSHSGEPVDHLMVEFFIVRKHRRGGVGTAAMNAITARYPGLWETAVVRRNEQAQAFWRKIAYSHGEAVELDYDNAAWNGPILRFRVAG